MASIDMSLHNSEKLTNNLQFQKYNVQGILSGCLSGFLSAYLPTLHKPGNSLLITFQCEMSFNPPTYDRQYTVFE